MRRSRKKGAQHKVIEIGLRVGRVHRSPEPCVGPQQTSNLGCRDGFFGKVDADRDAQAAPPDPERHRKIDPVVDLENSGGRVGCGAGCGAGWPRYRSIACEDFPRECKAARDGRLPASQMEGCPYLQKGAPNRDEILPRQNRIVGQDMEAG
jgi:hypothetical protein